MSDRSKKLAALRKKLKKTDLGGGGAGYWSPKVGKNTIRILPEVGDMDFFFVTVGRHYFPNGKNVYCPKFTSEGDLPCPVCEIVQDLYDAGDKASKALASEVGLRRSYWMNVIDRKDSEAGPLVFTPGVTIFNAIVALVNDPDYGDVMDPWEGTDIVIDRTGTGRETEYQVMARRNTSALAEDDDTIDKWLDAAGDLSWVEVSEDPEEDKDLAGDHAVYLYPYERIVEEHGLDEYDEDSFYEKDEPEEEDYQEDDGEDEDDEGEEPPVKKEVARRKARRSKRRRAR